MKKRVDRIEKEARHTVRPAARSRREPDFPGEDRLIGLAHLFACPGLQDRVGEIGDLHGFLARHRIGNIRMSGTGLIGPGPDSGSMNSSPGPFNQPVILSGAKFGMAAVGSAPPRGNSAKTQASAAHVVLRTCRLLRSFATRASFKLG